MKYFLLISSLMISSCFMDKTYYDVEWKGYNQKTVAMTDYQGKWAVINYWATWCKPCIEEMPLLQQYYAKNSSSVVVIGANIEHLYDKINANDILKFIKQYKITFPIVKANLIDNQTSFGPLKAVPMTVILNPQGKIKITKFGKINQNYLLEQIQS